MIELKVFTSFDFTEVLIGLLGVAFSLLTLKMVSRTKNPQLVFGILFLMAYTLFEVADEFVVKGVEKDLFFNIPSRIFLLLGIGLLGLSIASTFDTLMRSQRRKI